MPNCRCGCGATIKNKWARGHNHLRQDPIIRFWSKVRKTATCWLWQGSCDGKGYGFFHHGNKSLRPKMIRAHRWSYEHFVGPIPNDLTLDHKCRIPKCVNPAHLRPMTAVENVMIGFGAPAKNKRKKQCKYGHLFEENNIIKRLNGGRECLECSRRIKREWYRKNYHKRKGQLNAENKL